MNELIKVNYDSERPTILGRDLHEFLEVKSKYADWFKNMCIYGFIENVDFMTLSKKKAWNTPEMIMSRALKMAERQMKQLQIDNARLTVDNQIMKPKADYFDELVDRGLNTGIRETAKELHIKERKFVRFLIEKKYLYRDKKGALKPYSQYVDKLFTLKECMNDKTEWKGLQLLITPKGKETFKLLYLAAM